jgi:4-hydroxy-tetrahydrodipicolinate synthase
MSVFTGAGVAIITPMKPNGDINYDEFAKLIEFQIANGTDAIIVCGTTGEASTLSHEEHLDAIRFCTKQVNKRIPVVAGTGSNCTETAIYLSQEAQKAGVDGLLVVTPYYNKATQKGLYEHYKMIAQAVKLPIIMYNVPSRTGCNLQPATVVSLCNDVENIVGVKEASGNIAQVTHLMALAKGKVDVYSGNDDQIVPLLALGGKGVISVLSNIAPRQTHDICQLFFDGKVNESAKEQLRALELIDALFCEVNPIPVKKAVSLMGIVEGGPLRRPLSEMEEANVERLQKAMKDYGLI